MKRLRTGLLLALLFLASPAMAQTYKIASLSPDGSSWMVTMRGAAAEIAKATGGRVKFKFYPGGVMGNDDAVLRKMRIRQLHGAAMPGGALSRFYPDAEIYSMPLSFRSLTEVDHVRKHFDPKLVAGFEEAGFVTFGLAEGGLAYLMSKEPVQSVPEVRQRKVWIPANDDAALQAVQAFGINPFPLDLSNVLVSLQTGLIDTVATSPIAAIALQWHTRVKYITDLPLIYLYGVLAMDKKAFSKMSQPDQQAVRHIMGAAFQEIDQQNRRDNEQAMAALQVQGLSLLQPPAEQARTWQDIATATRKAMIDKGTVSRESGEKLNKLLEEYRAANP